MIHPLARFCREHGIHITVRHEGSDITLLVQLNGSPKRMAVIYNENDTEEVILKDLLNIIQRLKQ